MGYQIESTTASANLQFLRQDIGHSRTQAHKRRRRGLENITYEKAFERAEDSRKAADEALNRALRGESTQNIRTSIPGNGGRDERINLAKLFARLKELNDNPEAARQAAQATTEQVSLQAERKTTEIEISIDVNRPVYGLEVVNKNLAQTDRYLFEFRDGATLTIKDKWSGRSTTIFGDPHVDVDDLEGNSDGDFKDLTESERFTTFILQDGTRLTITALDTGIIEKVDIFLGTQHLQGTGAGSGDWEKQQLFDSKVQNGDGYESTLERGDMIKAGGDGNDWYNEAGALVWGKTTGPIVYTRPSLALEVKVKQTIETLNFVSHHDVSV
jgi:hypothetical protein